MLHALKFKCLYDVISKIKDEKARIFAIAVLKKIYL